MNESPSSNASARRAVPALVQAAGIVLTGAVVLTASAVLAWSLRSWRERPQPPRQGAGAAAARELTAPTDRQAVLLGAGRLAYQVHCARCHGSRGHGDGSDAERLVPPPRDFASRHWRLVPTPVAVRQAITAGIPGTAMPGWGGSLSPRELDGLVAYVLSLAPPDQDVPNQRAAAPLPSTLVDLVLRARFSALATPGFAPRLVLRDLDGTATSLAEHADRPVLVVFWGTTCSHCLAELPAVHRFAERHRALDVLPVCVDETDAAAVRAAAGPLAAERPLYVDPSATARLYYDVQALPSIVLIDASGRLIARAAGTRDWTNPALDELIHECLALSAPAPAGSPHETSRHEEENAPRPDHRPG
jgi:mono/diheme cytochrome c family protein